MVMNTFKSKLRKRRDELFRRTADEDADEWQFVPFNPSVFSGATLASYGGVRNGSVKSSGPLRPWALQRASWHDGAPPPVPPHNHQRVTDLGLYLPVGPKSELYPGSVPQWYGAQLPVNFCNGSGYPQSVPSGQSRPTHIPPACEIPRPSLSEDDEVLYRRPMTAKRDPRPRPVSAGNVASSRSPDEEVGAGYASPPVPPHKSPLDSRTLASSPRHAAVKKSKSIPPMTSAVPFSSYSPRPLSSKSAYRASNATHNNQNNAQSLAPVPDQREEDSSSPSPEYTLPVSCSSDASDSSDTPPPVPQHKEPFASFMNPPPASSTGRCHHTLVSMHDNMARVTPPLGWSSYSRPDVAPVLPKHGPSVPPPVPPHHATCLSPHLQKSSPLRPPPHKTMLLPSRTDAEKPPVPAHNTCLASKGKRPEFTEKRPAVPPHGNTDVTAKKNISPVVPRHHCLSSSISDLPPPPPPHSAPFPLTHSHSCPSGPLPASPDFPTSGLVSETPLSYPSGPLPRSPDSSFEESSPTASLPPLPPEPCISSPGRDSPESVECPDRSLPASPISHNEPNGLLPVPMPRNIGIFSNRMNNVESDSSLQSVDTSESSQSVSQNALLPIKPAVRRSHCRQSSLPPPPLYQNMYQPVEFQSNGDQPIAYQRLDEWSSVERLSLSNPNIGGSSSNPTSDADVSLDSLGSSTSGSRNSSRLSSQSSRHSPWLIPSPEDELQGLVPICQRLLDSPLHESCGAVFSSADATPSSEASSSNALGACDNNKSIACSQDSDKTEVQATSFCRNKISGTPASMTSSSLNSIDGLKSTHGFEEIRHQNGDIELLQIIEEPESFDDGDECSLDYYELPFCPDDSSSIHFIDSTSCSMVSSAIEGEKETDSEFIDGRIPTSLPFTQGIDDMNFDFSYLIPPQAYPEDDLSISESPPPPEEIAEETPEAETFPFFPTVTTTWFSFSSPDDDPESSNYPPHRDDVTDLSWCYSEPRSSLGGSSPVSSSFLESGKRSTGSSPSPGYQSHLLSLSNCLRSSTVHPMPPPPTPATRDALAHPEPPTSLNLSRPRSSCFERPSPSTSLDFISKLARPRSLFSALQSPSFTPSPNAQTPEQLSTFVHAVATSVGSLRCIRLLIAYLHLSPLHSSSFFLCINLHPSSSVSSSRIFIFLLNAPLHPPPHIHSSSIFSASL
ncbi:flocculation protein FLO11-like [Hyalella azteca]|uniref:Flocculation protein FLO11-like n=1 Tax=Hyalella azteca TaxID=294128 RepID=A0A8B7NFM6_HYAAZ|nr:flocculation protein FLO11-like [Hyalella azteca]